MAELLNKSRQVVSYLILFLAFSQLANCSVKLVADYDAAVAESIIEVAQRVDTFYTRLLETPQDERKYVKSVDNYIAIEVELRSLVMRNKIRRLNDESIEIAETTLEKWSKYKKAHKENDLYKDALVLLHRERFTKLFTAMAIAEEAKRLTSED